MSVVGYYGWEIWDNRLADWLTGWQIWCLLDGNECASIQALSTRVPSHHRCFPSPFPIAHRVLITLPHCTKMWLIPYFTTTLFLIYPSFSSSRLSSLSAQCHPPTSQYLYYPFLSFLSFPSCLFPFPSRSCTEYETTRLDTSSVSYLQC